MSPPYSGIVVIYALTYLPRKYLSAEETRERGRERETESAAEEARFPFLPPQIPRSSSVDVKSARKQGLPAGGFRSVQDSRERYPARPADLAGRREVGEGRADRQRRRRRRPIALQIPLPPFRRSGARAMAISLDPGLPRRRGCSAASAASLFVFLLSVNWIRPAAAEIRFSEIRKDARSIIPFDEFGFTHAGVLELNVSKIAFSNPSPDLDLSQLGFFLSTRDAWIHVVQQIQDTEITCALHSNLIKTVFTLDHLPRLPSTGAAIPPPADSFGVVVPEGEPDQFTLVFANCLPQVQVSMDVLSVMYNKDPRTGHRDYLSAGATVLPRIFFLFFLVYAALACVWVYVLYRKRSTAFRIHYFMLAVVVLKAFNLLCEAEDKSYIKRTGSAHGWDVLFYIFSFLKGITLFTLIVLIGTGWSFLKPYLQDKEKRVLMIVIPLQVVANIAQVVIDESGPYARDWITWKQVFLLVDVICCCAVLFPIVWSIKNLREAARTDGKAAVNLMKLTLFRQYYIVVICYIYFTRVVVYAFATITSYRYLWTSVVAGELATLAFYVFTGYKFRPEVHNPYFVIDDDEEEAAAEALKLDDEFEL
ncbi:hypothetical protein Taro_019224 [Colocasia esculenta]|uniref:Protein GPR107 n=1 Tax=Colocasia esculenta TaxID=4460 RepID=A0A843UTD4_COLES|nr:hypothetical protein [Colocasia esculenta]